MIVETRPWTPSRDLLPPFRILAVAGGAVLALGLAMAPVRAWENVLLAGWYLLALGLAGLAFVAVQYVTGAGWATVFRRVPEALAGLIPVGGGLVLAAVVLGGQRLYPWLGGELLGQELHGFKAFWLQPGFFFGRGLAYFTVWLLFGSAILANSRRQDATGDPGLTRRNVRLSAGFLVAFGFTLWLASVDWLMSLEPHWFSTIYGLYHFSGLFLSGVAAIAALVVWLRRTGPLAGAVNKEHLHDLGKLLFAFSTFWMYIWFSQFMLIWYGGIPEETVHYAQRLTGAWAPLFWVNVALNWVIPFAALLPASSKRSEKVLLRVALVVLAGRWLDLYLAIAPAVDGSAPHFGAWEAAAILGAAGLFFLVFTRTLQSAPVIPAGDPYLEESLHHHG